MSMENLVQVVQVDNRPDSVVSRLIFFNTSKMVTMWENCYSSLNRFYVFIVLVCRRNIRRDAY